MAPINLQPTMNLANKLKQCELSVDVILKISRKILNWTKF